MECKMPAFCKAFGRFHMRNACVSQGFLAIFSMLKPLFLAKNGKIQGNLTDPMEQNPENPEIQNPESRNMAGGFFILVVLRTRCPSAYFNWSDKLGGHQRGASSSMRFCFASRSFLVSWAEYHSNPKIQGGSASLRGDP